MAKAKAAKKPRCLTCKNASKVRGLCQSCYEAAKAAMRDGTSEQTLVDAGLMLARKKPSGRPPNSGFAKALSQKVKQ
jgi:hypothetical protein